MDRLLLLIATMFVSSGTTSAPTSVDSFKVFARENGIRVESSWMSATASRLMFDNTSGRLVLEGSGNALAELNRTIEGRRSQIRGHKIMISLKNGETKVEGIRFLKVTPK
jgi:hypothetical protein